MPRRRRHQLTETERRNLMTRSASLNALSQHPSWPELENVVLEQRERLEREMLRRALHASAGRFAAPVNQREVDYLRGFIGGMEWMVAVPTSAQTTLENYLKQQGYALEGDRQ